MKILITTPTGKIGRRVLRELIAPEFSVRVVARNPERLPDDIRGEAEIVRGSSDDTAVLRRALDGVEALFWCVPPPELREVDVRGHYERLARAAAEAIRAAGTPRVVTISSGGKGLARNAGPISGLHAMEDILNETGAAIRHLRCGAFMENFLTQAHAIAAQGKFSYPMPGHIPIPLAAVSDIADTVLRWLVRRDWNGVAGVGVLGPEDVSFGEAAAVIARALGREVRYHELQPNQYVQCLMRCGASELLARDMVDMFGELANGIMRAEPRTYDSTTPTTLASWVRRELLPVIEPWKANANNAAAMPVCTC